MSSASWDGVRSSAVYRPSRIARRTVASRRCLSAALVKPHHAGEAYSSLDRTTALYTCLSESSLSSFRAWRDCALFPMTSYWVWDYIIVCFMYCRRRRGWRHRRWWQHEWSWYWLYWPSRCCGGGGCVVPARPRPLHQVHMPRRSPDSMFGGRMSAAELWMGNGWRGVLPVPMSWCRRRHNHCTSTYVPLCCGHSIECKLTPATRSP